MKAIDGDKVVAYLEKKREEGYMNKHFAYSLILSQIIQYVKDLPEIKSETPETEQEFELPESYADYMMRDFERKR